MGNKSIITVKTTFVATLVDATNKEANVTANAVFVEKYIKKAQNPEIVAQTPEREFK